MKILIISQYFYPEQMRINDVVRLLTEDGNEVTVLTGLPNYPEGKIYPGYRFGKSKKQKLFGAEVIRVPLIARHHSLLFLAANYISFMITASLRVLFLKKDYDAVFVYQLSPVLMACPAVLAKKLKRKKLVLYCLDMWPESFKYGKINESNPLFKIIAGISKKIYASCDIICTTSETHKKYMHEVNGIEEKKIELLYQYEIRNSDVIKKLPKSVYNVTYAGNIGKLQSVETIVKVAELLEDENIFFHIIGSGSELTKCKKYAESRNLNNITFYGQLPLNETQAYIKGSDINLICMKSGSETDYPFPGKIQTALMCGTPVIYTSDSEGARFIVKTGCGIRCEAENPDKLAEAIKTLAGDCDKRALFSKNARETYEKYFSVNNFKEKLISFLQ